MDDFKKTVPESPEDRVDMRHTAKKVNDKTYKSRDANKAFARTERQTAAIASASRDNNDALQDTAAPSPARNLFIRGDRLSPEHHAHCTDENCGAHGGGSTHAGGACHDDCCDHSHAKAHGNLPKHHGQHENCAACERYHHRHAGCDCCNLSAKLSREKTKVKIITPENIIFAIGIVLFVFAMLFRFENFYLELFKFIAIYILLGYQIIVNCAKNVIHGEIFDENLLMLLAGIGAFILGEYFEAVAIVIFFTVGERFQDYAVSKSADKIKKTIDIIPANACKITDTGEEILPTTALSVGDRIRVRAGERIPTDCTLLSEDAYLDTSGLTGESMERRFAAGDELSGGCINTRNVVEAQVLRTSENSAAGKIVDMIQIAAGKKSKSENFITKFAKIYTPIVILAAVLIAAIPPIFGQPFAQYFKTALTFLLVACPCAIVVSVPLCFFNGLGKCAAVGALIKGSNYLNTLSNIDTVIFDKTGTLTESTFSVQKKVSVSALSEDEILSRIAALEFYSNHPLAKSITAAAEPKSYAFTEIHEIAGSGIEATFEGKKIFVGKCPEGKALGTSVGLYEDGTLLGYVILAASVKEHTKKALDLLRHYGIRHTALLSGDNQSACERVARDLGIDETYSEKSPVEKLEIVESVTAKHKLKTAYVGDGINDVLALSRADLGVSASDIQDAAIVSADVVLTSSSILPFAKAKGIARKTARKVKINIAFALAVKIAVMLLSIFFPLPLFTAVLADVGCCLITILISLL